MDDSRLTQFNMERPRKAWGYKEINYSYRGYFIIEAVL
jgi:hypothetical protein